jgi:hypothetical protein
MKIAIAAAMLSALALTTLAQAQTADDRKWVARCLMDNADAKVAQTVVQTYCTCMNDKMDDNETRSITTWEKANPVAKKECEQKSGWN